MRKTEYQKPTRASYVRRPARWTQHVGSTRRTRSPYRNILKENFTDGVPMPSGAQGRIEGSLAALQMEVRFDLLDSVNPATWRTQRSQYGSQLHEIGPKRTHGESCWRSTGQSEMRPNRTMREARLGEVIENDA